MCIQAGVGIARGSDGFEAGTHAATMALAQAGCARADAAIVFSAVRYDSEDVRRGVLSVLPKAAIVGCSDSGLVSSAGVVRGAVGVMVLKGDSLQAAVASVDNLDLAPGKAAGDLADSAAALSETARLHLLLIDGLAARGAAAVAGFQERMGANGVPIAGGCAGDGLRFASSYQFSSGGSTNNGAALLSLGGDVRMGVGVRHGFSPLSGWQQITQACDNVVSEIAGRPAVDYYKDYFGAAAQEIAEEPMAMLCAEYPLSVSTGDGSRLIRDVLRLRDGGELQVAGNVSTGQNVTLMTATKQDLLNAAEQAALEALASLEGKKPSAALIFNCVGRLKIFGSQAATEIERISRVVGPETPLLGFYTYGELAPQAPCRPCHLHNKTVVVILLA
jgi:hypothetical protein